MASTLDQATVTRLFVKADAERWHVSREAFEAAVEAGVARAFPGKQPASRELERHLAALHLADLALALACAAGVEAAWDHFVREHRPVLYRAAEAIDRSGRARELADSLYADLYGLDDSGGERRSLFRYFHGRSSLATWLRAVLAQRHVDALRAGRRTDPLSDDDRETLAVRPSQADPDRPRLMSLVMDALRAAVDRLTPKDRLRVRGYYVLELTLAQIGRITGEHEATVSRHLARTRRDLRGAVERALRDEARLTAAEIERCFELAIDDPGSLDLQTLLGAAERKNPGPQRST